MNFIIKGDFAFSRSLAEIQTSSGYLVSVDGKTVGIFPKIPDAYRGLPLFDHTGKLIVPGMVDLHIHAPQFAFRGMYMDEELLDWLKKYTFPEESRYADPAYARCAYSQFAEAMRKSATTRAVIFGTVHRPATTLLMELMEETGLISYVGKVNMDRGAPDDILDPSADLSAYNTFGWLNDTVGKFPHTFPILTPRFIPSCTDALMNELREILHTYDIPLQSHLSESPGELELVHQLMPDSPFYGEGYDRYEMFGTACRTVMAHCIYSSPEEVELMKKNGVFVAHCPSSNLNLSSGIAPIRHYLECGLTIGLGTDTAAGENESIFNEIIKAIEVSKMYCRYLDPASRALTFPEAFYMATLAGGSFFGRVGSFEEGFDTDLIVLDDDAEPHPQPLSIKERLERSVYLGIDRGHIVAKFAAGEKLF